MSLNYSKRASYLQEYAKYMKMSYNPTDEWGLMNRLLDFDLFRKGRQKVIFNLMEKKDAFMDEQVYIFDYAYTRGKKKKNDRHRYMQTVFFMQSKHLGLPEFLMKPETFFHKVGNYLGMSHDIDFVEHPEFSEQYLLQSSDEDRLRGLMNDEILHFFKVEKDWSLEGIGYFMIFYKHNTLLSPATIEYFHKKGMGIYDQMKGK